MAQNFAESKKSTTFATLFKGKRTRALSSAGSERLPYKQRVGGSNPSAPTTKHLQQHCTQVLFYAPPREPPSLNSYHDIAVIS